MTHPSTVAPGWLGLAWAGVPLGLTMVVLAWQRLGQVRPLSIAIARLVLQLWLLGLVLQAIFDARSLPIVLLTASVMLIVSAHTVGGRLKTDRWRIRVESFLGMGLAIAATMAVFTKLALNLDPWYAPSIFIPLFGMILGNSVTGISLAAERFAADLKTDRDLVEQRLALGATSRHAAAPALRAAIRAGLTPVINNMMIVGIVSIPGMTTGSLLAGGEVLASLRLQVLVYLGISTTTAMSTLIVLFLRLRRVFTAAHQLREM